MTEAIQEGPTPTKVIYYCGECKYHEQEKYTEPDDSDWGYYHYCSHPNVQIHSDPDRLKDIGYSDRTPKWCPFLPTENND
ncbi:hypothetical protein SCRM01_279 [Synechococcus phage S-CRM01]|uniref:hypothetical protein n=1 Tax=Synechococcus phage S-CRM01 TaxID=1026955 RepID=UPI000209E313|nr:hypothetical protein SCRM01_279 [Synechococcus phage S-CRM01]AEC53225.1 hypothetical protein SCRM01_279 [Synechococcus phage S-CRM01]